ncbi:DUF2017 family protein [Jannaschia sp. R86511]|uniref:DUF2017 family protein n=1 Tax=Jannaschia sp. R86511 TaxID=3093853 RepID=UPI0036D4045B
MSGFRALVRRRRDGRVVFDLDVVHAGVVAEALEQTRAVLLDDVAPAQDDDGLLGDRSTGAGAGAGAETASGPGPASDGGRAVPDEFDAIVAGLGDVADEESARRSAAAEAGRDDPVVRRLLPDVYLDDAAGSAEFRRLSGDVVRTTKVSAIDSVLTDLALLRDTDGALTVSPERAAAWLTALNDARLALGTLLAVGEDDDLHSELDAYEQQLAEGGLQGDEPADQALRAYRIAVYDFLSALLDMVVRVLDR